MRMLILAADTVFQVAYLREPKAFLVFYISFFGKIGDAEYSFVGNRTLLYAKFKKFFIVIIIPAITYIFIFKLVNNFCGINCAVPAEEERMIALINFICKPFLEANGGRQKLVKYSWGALYGKLHGVHYFLFTHLLKIHKS